MFRGTQFYVTELMLDNMVRGKGDTKGIPDAEGVGSNHATSSN